MNTVPRKWEHQDTVFLGLLLLLTFCFNILHVNKFYTITEGWFQDFGRYILDGEVPYRDFYLFVPPIWPLMMTVITALSDNLFLAFRIYGVLERLLVVGLAFLILRRSFRADQVFIALLAASAIYISNIQDIFYGYYQTSLLFILVLLWLSIRLCECDDEKKRVLYAVLFGACGGVTVLCKLPAGVIMTFILGFCAFFILLKKGAGVWRTVGVAVLAYAAALLLCLLPWVLLGAFQPMIEQLLMGSSSKGSILTILFGFFPKLISSLSVKYMLAAAGLTAAIVIGGRYPAKKPGAEGRAALSLLIGLGQNAVLFLIFLPFLTDAHFIRYFGDFSWKLRLLLFGIAGAGIFCSVCLTKAALEKKLSMREWICYLAGSAVFSLTVMVLLVYIIGCNAGYLDWNAERTHARLGFNHAAFYIVTAIALYYFIRVLTDNTKDRSVRLLTIAAAWGILYIHGMSNTIEDHAMLLAFSFMACLVLESRFVSMNGIKNAMVYLFCLFSFVCIFVQRCYLPYNWWGVYDIAPVYEADSTYKDPKLAGLKGNEWAVTAVDEINDIISATKKEGDTMVTFPHISCFNVMSGLKNNLFAKTHFFDVCCDDVAIADAERLKADPPTYLVWMDISQSAWTVHEELFRGGEPCGQHALQEAYEELVASGNYTLLWKGYVWASDPISVWRLNE